MTFVQQGTSLSGTYDWSVGGRTSGRMIDDEYHGNFWDKGGEGDFIYRFTFTPDRKSFQMDWRLKGETKWRDGGRCERR